MNDLISRQDAIDAVCKACSMVEDYHKCDGYPETSTWCDELVALRALPSAQPDNQINLCDSCEYLYPDCASKNDDVIFGNSIGNDNICACNKYKPSAQPKRKKGKWIEEEKGIHVTSYRCSECGRTVMDDTGYDVSADYPFCNCGADMRGDD